LGVDSYIIKRSEAAQGPYTQLGEVTGTTYTDTTANINTTYYYIVKSKNTKGESINSAPVVSLKKADPGLQIKIPDITDSNGLLWFNFDETNGSTSAKSSLTNKLSSTGLVGNFTGADGKNNGAFFFDGNNDYIKLNQDDTSSGILHQTYNKLTVSFWMRPYSLDGKQMIYKQGGDAAGISIRINNGKLQTGVVTGPIDQGASTQLIASDIALNDSYINRWTHVTVSFDNGKVKIYLDAKLVFEGAAKASTIPAAAKSSTLGGCLNINAFRDGDVSQWYYGMLDDVRIYSEVVTPVLESGNPTDPTNTPDPTDKVTNPPEQQPDTGDSGTNMILSLIMLLSILIGAGIVLRNKKELSKR
jgi:LPXTG-motif cell wall-anchored protein